MSLSEVRECTHGRLTDCHGCWTDGRSREAHLSRENTALRKRVRVLRVNVRRVQAACELWHRIAGGYIERYGANRPPTLTDEVLEALEKYVGECATLRRVFSLSYDLEDLARASDFLTAHRAWLKSQHPTEDPDDD